MTHFKKLELRNWRQFRKVSLNLHPRLTVVTGANGSGKSTILNVFSQHFGFARPLISTPVADRLGGYSYDSGFFVPADEPEDEPLLPLIAPPMMITHPGMPQEQEQPFDVGRIEYSNRTIAGISVPRAANAYGLMIQPQQAVAGVHISSHRIMAPYQPVQGIAMQAMLLEQAFNLYNNELMARYNGQQTQLSPVYRMKETLIGMAAFGEGNSRLQRNEALLEGYNEFVDILRVVLPEELGFRDLVVIIPDIVLRTHSGDFVLDAASGGVNALVELCWQLFLYSKTPAAWDGFVATIDEPENHLHPSMQRTIVPNLLTAFPQVQFIVATHSPFVVSSVENSNVYALRYKELRTNGMGGNSQLSRRIFSTKLDQATKAGSASEVLSEVLGVEVTLPDWALDRMETLVEAYKNKAISPAVLEELRLELNAVGFEHFYPQAVARLVSSDQA